MRTTIVTPPAAEPVLLTGSDGLKKHLNVDDSFTDDDGYITSLQKVARIHVEDITWRKLISQTWKMWLQDWPSNGEIIIPYGRLQSVTSITYTGSDDTEYTDFDEDDEFTVDTDSDPGRVCLKYGESYPSVTLATQNPICITFVCGYGDAGSDVPDTILLAIKLFVAEMYRNREINLLGISKTTLEAFDCLLAPYRLWY
jgi:uncharacterized phiE125 gp8 family phage protein